MKLFGKKAMSLAASSLLAASMLVGGCAGVYADDSAAEAVGLAMAKTFTCESPVISFDAGELGKSKQSTTDFTFSGYVPMGEEVSEVTADVKATVDLDAGAMSFDGDVNYGGMDIDFTAYIDGSKLVVSVPAFLGEQSLSYDFSEDQTDSYLASMMGADTLAEINAQLRGVMSGIQAQVDAKEAEEEASGAVAEVFSSFWTGLEFTGPESAELDGAEVEAYKTTLTSDQIASLWDSVKNMQAGSMTLGQIFEMTQSGSSTGVSLDEIDAAIAEMPDLAYTYYVADDYCIGMDVLAAEDESEIISMRFSGEEEPWRNIQILSEGEDVADITTTQDGQSETVELTVDGESYGSLTYNGETKAYSLNLPEDLGIGEISGACGIEDGKLVFSVSALGYDLSITSEAGGEVAEPSGDALELSTASEDDLSALFGALSGMDSAA